MLGCPTVSRLSKAQRSTETALIGSGNAQPDMFFKSSQMKELKCQNEAHSLAWLWNMHRVHSLTFRKQYFLALIRYFRFIHARYALR